MDIGRRGSGRRRRRLSYTARGADDALLLGETGTEHEQPPYPERRYLRGDERIGEKPSKVKDEGIASPVMSYLSYSTLQEEYSLACMDTQCDKSVNYLYYQHFLCMNV